MYNIRHETLCNELCIIHVSSIRVQSISGHMGTLIVMNYDSQIFFTSVKLGNPPPANYTNHQNLLAFVSAVFCQFQSSFLLNFLQKFLFLSLPLPVVFGPTKTKVARFIFTAGGFGWCSWRGWGCPYMMTSLDQRGSLVRGERLAQWVYPTA